MLYEVITLGSAARTVLQDSIKPTLTVTTPSADTVTRQSATTIAGKVTDTLSDVVVRITSYNVCYTKLLRSHAKLLANLSFLPLRKGLISARHSRKTDWEVADEKTQFDGCIDAGRASGCQYGILRT